MWNLNVLNVDVTIINSVMLYSSISRLWYKGFSNSCSNLCINTQTFKSRFITVSSKCTPPIIPTSLRFVLNCHHPLCQTSLKFLILYLFSPVLCGLGYLGDRMISSFGAKRLHFTPTLPVFATWSRPIILTPLRLHFLNLKMRRKGISEIYNLVRLNWMQNF